MKKLMGVLVALAAVSACAQSEGPFDRKRHPLLGEVPGEVELAPGEAIVTIDGELRPMVASLPWPSVSEFLELWEGGACLPDEPTFDGFIVDREALWAAYDNEIPLLPYTAEFEPYDDETTTLAVEVMKLTAEVMTFGPSEHVRSTLHSVTRAELPDPWTGEVRDVIALMRGSFEIVDLWGRHVVAEYNAQNCMAAGCDNCRGLSTAVNGWYAEDDEI